jgi:hypothetical protein
MHQNKINTNNMNKESYPKFLKKEADGIFVKVFNQWEYCMLKIKKGKQGYYYSIAKTECTDSTTSIIINDMGFDNSTEQEYINMLTVFAKFGHTTFSALNKK